MLEAAWNAKLQALADARQAVEQQRQQDEHRLSDQERQRLRDAPPLFARLWADPQTPVRERKRIVRLIIEDVTLTKTEHILAQIRFKGGATHSLTIPLPPPFAQSRLTPAATLAQIDQLLDRYTDAEVADHLNAQGWHTFVGLPFQATHVSALRRKHGLKNRYTRLRAAGMLTVEELAAHLGVTAQTIWRWYRGGLIQGMRYNDRGSCLFPLPDSIPSFKRRKRASFASKDLD